MATRTVRLDDEAESALRDIRDRTGLPISEALKRGLRALQQEIREKVERLPYDVYRELDLGPRRLRHCALRRDPPRRCRNVTQEASSMILVDSEPLYTTVPVLTEAFHMLQPGSVGSDRLRDFVQQRGVSVWFLDYQSLGRAFELMERYADHSMDLAGASLIVAAESLGTRKVFTIDRQDFAAYRIRKGHRHYSAEIVG